MDQDPNNGDRFVSQTSFHDVLTLLAENREVARQQLAGISNQLAEVGRQITTRQDRQNGRMGDAEESIADLRTDVGVVKVQVASVKTEVDEILTKGCHKRTEHVKELSEALLLRRTAFPGIDLGAGDAPQEPTQFLGLGWAKPRTLKRVGVGGGLVGFGVLLPHIINGVHWLIEHFTYVAPTAK